jgi:tetratricopeptide (TPR) repeat protein
MEGMVGSCTLHDEMRDLVKRHVLPIVDSVGMYRLEWSKKIIKYYGERIEKAPDQTERQNLSLERLFYWLDADLEAAFDYSGVLFSEAMDKYDTDFMEALNSEIDRKDREKALPPTLHRRSEFRKGAVMLRRERYPEAVRILTGLLGDPACEPALQASARARLVESYVYSGEPQMAIDLGLRGEIWFDILLGQLKPDDPHRRRIERDFGWLCNSLGLAFRSQNRLDQTVEYYNKALDHFSNVDGAQSHIASTKNNLGYVYHRLARDDEALSECETALMIRKRLGSPDQLGYSYNVLGMIRQDQARGEEAIDWFERALHAFREADSERGQALVNVSYGRLMRQWGFLMERQAEGKPDAGRQQYQKAQGMLDTAIWVFRQMNDRSNLSEALNEKGTLLRQQRQWDEAIRCFDESADLARQIGNQYREVDTLQDIGILYYSIGKLDRAQEYSQRASDLARKMGFHYLFARSQRTFANIMFKQGDYDLAFEMAGDALVYFVKVDPEASSYKIAKREIFYDEWLDWICEQMILGLPLHELAQRYAGYLIERWEQETSGGQRLADLYPGVIPRIRDIARNYPFLTAQR